jgi:succinate dehydrogenase (ubiquinone) cytochrome b560 subunit
MNSRVLTAMKSTESLSYSEKQAAKGRPVSPHVNIYKFPVAALTSITNRVTGVLLSVGVTGIGGLCLAGIDVPAMMSAIGDVIIVGHLFKFGVSFPLVYHYLGGVRHLVWDKMPETTLNNASVEQSSYILFGTATVASLAITVAL